MEPIRGNVISPRRKEKKLKHDYLGVTKNFWLLTLEKMKINTQAGEHMNKNNHLFADDLLEKEEVLWIGQPIKKNLFTLSDIILIPFSIIWCAIALLWEFIAVYGVTEGKSNDIVGIIIPLIGIPFILAGLYLVMGRYFYKQYIKKNTYYAVTNKRVLILTSFRNKNIETEYINNISQISRKVNSHGIGNITFGKPSYYYSFFANTGLDFLGSFYRKVLSFYDIPDVNKVYHLVNTAKHNS